MKLISTYAFKEINLQTGEVHIEDDSILYSIGDKVTVFDNSYFIDPDDPNATTIIGGQSSETIYYKKEATVLKNNLKKTIKKKWDVKVLEINCSLLIQYDDGKQFYIAPSCVYKGERW